MKTSVKPPGNFRGSKDVKTKNGVFKPDLKVFPVRKKSGNVCTKWWPNVFCNTVQRTIFDARMDMVPVYTDTCKLLLGVCRGGTDCLVGMCVRRLCAMAHV